ncbi:family 20 glycosylhydrolase [Dyadobacter psychrotolerans]|uniref:beta-N-acetylhexosaminidase n=1 Tax=Dyadobacter psychrotolerans TaxID=2541721 RepID=A0A4V2Z442_9BACT|nr:family 20 glycosylhydrolase [Dyadobacter psychrotolerans]TDE14668.1 beta-N-acetylhexosaminidase [Dyadobacter psychrotolerans]
MNYKIRLIQLCLLLSFSIACCSAQDVRLTYKIQLKAASPMRTAVLITNSGKESLPAKGWNIYFNSFKRLVDEKNPDFTITSIHGGLYRLSPTESFASLPSGASREIKITAEDSRNISDMPLGFYIVWDKNPEKGYSLTNTDPGYISAIPSEPEFAAKIFSQNTQLKDLPAPQKILPTPVKYEEKSGVFRLDFSAKIVTDASFSKEANLLAADLEKLLGRKPAVLPKSTGKVIILQKAHLPENTYQLSVNSDKITITASTATGIFYGMQSLKVLMPPKSWAVKQSFINIPAVEVTDSPRFEHRALLVDVARNFIKKEEILKTLEVMALYKMNVLHFHFSDDEGWRLEIPGLPELTQVGSQRGHTLTSEKYLPPTYGSGPQTGVSSGSGFYTRNDFTEILRFAKQRHIQVIPEIESPGHARAAIMSMEARYKNLSAKGEKQAAEKYRLADPQDQSTYRSVQMWRDNVVNVALPSVYNFMKKITDELVLMYKEADAPLTTIHFGGDEVPAGVWEKSPAVNELLAKDKSIENVDGLWKYYFSKVHEMLKSRNLYMSGWEEIGMKKVLKNGKKRMIEDSTVADRNYHADVWNNLLGTGAEDLAYRMANMGYKIILSNVTNNYLDMAANKSFHEPGMFWGGYVDIDKPYYFIPYNYYKNSKENLDGDPIAANAYAGKQQLSVAARKNITGLQAALWSETIATPERFEFMLLPKVISVAERSWAKDPEWVSELDTTQSKVLYQKAWNAYVATLNQREMPRLDSYSGGFNYRIPTPGVLIKDGKIFANNQSKNLKTHYTTDGSEPTVKSALYSQPLTSKGNYLFRTFNEKARGSQTIRVVFE